jgi:hypothetical protein
MGLILVGQLPEIIIDALHIVDHAPRADSGVAVAGHVLDHAADFIRFADPQDGIIDAGTERRDPVGGRPAEHS